jgi:hypothetical protein
VSPALTPARLDAALVLVFFGLKVWLNDQAIDWWYDGNYYADIARHLAAGDGFVSSISMFHAGFPSFPFPSSVYPLWPLLLGTVARFVPLETAAVWLPTALYLSTLPVVAQIGRRLLPARPFEALPFDGGHLTLLCWALANRFVEFTSVPYTEGLALLLLAVALLRIGTSRPTVAGGVEAGLWCALLLAARGPFVVLVAAILGVLWLAEGRLRRALAATLTLALCAVLADQLWFRTIPGASLSTLLRFDRWVVTPGLSGYDLLVQKPGWGALLQDRLKGLSAAYSIAGPFRLMRNFGFIAFLPFLALIPGVAREVGATLRTSLLARLTFAVGLTQLVLLHALHKQTFAEWNFGMRHALPVLWLYVTLLPALFGTALRTTAPGRAARALAAALLAGGLSLGLEMSMGRKNSMVYKPESRAHREAVGRWLLAQRETDPDLRVAHPTPQLFVRHAPGVGFIATHPFTKLADLDVMVASGGMDFLVLPNSVVREPRYPFQKDKAAFEKRFEVVPGPLAGSTVYRPRKESP